MSRFKQILAGKVLLILLAAGALTFVSTTTDLKLGLDLSGGTQLDYSLDLSEVPEENQSQIVEGVREVIERRVNALGVSEPNIYTANVGDEQHIVVELAGISDIEEAKATVGKTIQLEFREENDEEDNDKTEWAQAASNDFYGQVAGGSDFEETVESLQESAEGQISFELVEDQETGSMDEAILQLLEGKQAGALIGPSEINNGYVFSVGGNIQESIGMGVLQITDTYTEETENEIEEEVSARHVLIGFESAERSDATRSKKEAQELAEEVLEKAQAGESFEELAKQYSEDLGSGSQGGDLGSFARGKMVAPFEEAAFALEIDGISEIVESEFGFHIIQVYDKQEATTEKIEKRFFSYNKAFFSTTPDPWKKEATITGEHFKYAEVSFNHTDYSPLVNITFTKEGADLFEELTGNNVGKQIAIFVGGDLISAPRVSNAIAGGNAQITGEFSLEEAQELARDLNTGAIPAPIELTGQYTISATLGAQALDQSLQAGLIGLIVLAAFMILYYRIPGLVATVALAIYSALIVFFVKIAMPTWAALLIGLTVFGFLVYLILKSKESGGEKFLAFLISCFVLFFLTFVLASPITMTLAGIAGVILSIGMAVDANVLIFERTKEELREGKSLQVAIDEGFHRAWDSIRDSNFSSLITCAILFYFGSSIIRGFALNLALGILISMLSAILLTKTFLTFAANTKLAEKPWLFGKPKGKELNLPIIKRSAIWAALSGTLITVSVVVLAAFGLRMGLDFTGGAMMEVAFETEELPATTEVAENISATLNEGEEEVASPQVVSTDQDTYLVRLGHLSEEQHDAVISGLETSYGEVEEIRFTTVGPSIGQSMKKKAIIALAVTLVAIVLYIAFAFRRIPKEVSPWRFGMCAIAALVHDILIVLGVFVLLGQYAGVEVDALFITALLTIMGFSVHDTIVVFDRVRENLMFRKSANALEESANKALNQTMARSLNTSVSTLITIVALWLLGADSIEWFVFALLIGIVAGTYSSLFVATPLLVWWNKKAN